MISIKRKIISFLITGAALIVLFLVAVNTGSLKASPEQILRGLFVAYDETVATIYSLRFPRILIAMLAGASVAVSGVMLQAVMKNPLADPGIMGISSGAGMAAVLVTAFAPITVSGGSCICVFRRCLCVWTCVSAFLEGGFESSQGDFDRCGGECIFYWADVRRRKHDGSEL